MLHKLCICFIILMFDYFINLRKKVYELSVSHFSNRREKIIPGQESGIPKFWLIGSAEGS